MAPAQRLRPVLLEAALVAAAAFVLSALVFARPVLAHLNSHVLGVGRDPQIIVWAIAWWPHALGHGLDPLTTHEMWAGRGFDVLWTSSVPGLSLLVAPVTLLWGPIAAFNLLAITAPGFAAGALHVLCRGLGARRAAATAAALLFAICPYEAASMTGHLHLSFCAPGILAAGLVVWAAREPRVRAAWIAAVAAAAALEFLVAPELFATFAGAGAAALALAAALRREARPALAVAARTLAAALALAVVVCAPLVVRMATHGPGRLYPPESYSLDALSLIVPTPLTALRPHFAAQVAWRFMDGNFAEQPGYLGLVLVAFVAVLALRRETRRAFAVPLAFLAVAVVASLGPRLQIQGIRGGPLPMAAVSHLPLLENVLPARLALFAWLAVGVILALWLSRPRHGALRWAVFALAAASVAPAAAQSANWYAPAHTGRFFTAHADRRLLRPGEHVLVVPIIASDAYGAQAEEGFRWALVNGTRPDTVAYDPRNPSTAAPLLRRDEMDAAVVDGRADSLWRPTLERAGLRPRAVAGAFLYRWR